MNLCVWCKQILRFTVWSLLLASLFKTKKCFREFLNKLFVVHKISIWKKKYPASIGEWVHYRVNPNICVRYWKKSCIFPTLLVYYMEDVPHGCLFIICCGTYCNIAIFLIGKRSWTEQKVPNSIVFIIFRWANTNGWNLQIYTKSPIHSLCHAQSTKIEGKQRVLIVKVESFTCVRNYTLPYLLCL